MRRLPHISPFSLGRKWRECSRVAGPYDGAKEGTCSCTGKALAGLPRGASSPGCSPHSLTWTPPGATLSHLRLWTSTWCPVPRPQEPTEEKEGEGHGKAVSVLGVGESRPDRLPGVTSWNGWVPRADRTGDSLCSRQGRTQATGLSLAEVVEPRETYVTHASHSPPGVAPLHTVLQHQRQLQPLQPVTVTAGRTRALTAQGAGLEGSGTMLSSPLPSSWQSPAFRNRRIFFFLFLKLSTQRETLTSLWGAHSGFYHPDCQEILPCVSHEPFPP